MIRLVSAVALFLTSATALGAQAAQFDSSGRDSRITVGSRVRFLRDTAAAPVDGRVLSLFGDTMDVEDRSSLVRQRVSLRDVARLEVRRRDPGLTTGLGVTGFVTGAAFYVKWCLANQEECRQLEQEEAEDCDDTQQTTLFSAMSIGGLLIGGALGYLLTPPSWERIDRPYRFGVLPTRGGVMLYASLRTR